MAIQFGKRFHWLKPKEDEDIMVIWHAEDGAKTHDGAALKPIPPRAKPLLL